MTKNAEAVEAVEAEGADLDSMLDEWEADQAEAEAEANRPDPEELEKARRLAEKMNSGFLWMVHKTQAPHVDLKQVIDQQEGVEAFTPIAEKWGGEVPAWIVQFQPYIGAGLYIGTAIAQARAAEAQAVEILKERQRQRMQQGAEQQNGGQDGKEPSA